MKISYTDLPSWVQWLVVLVIIIAAVAAIAGSAKAVWPVMARMVRNLDNLEKLPAFIEEQDKFRADINKTIQSMNHELSPNGGSSLVDRSVRNEASILKILTGQEHIKRQLMSVKTTSANSDKKLNAHLIESANILQRLHENNQLPKDTP